MTRSPPPRVAVVSSAWAVPALAPGGAAVHLRGVAGGFAELGADVELWTPRVEPGAHRGPAAAPPAGVRVVQAPRGRLPGTLRRSARLDRRVDARAMARWAARRARIWRLRLVWERMALFGAVGAAVRRSCGATWVLELNAPLAWESCWYEGLRPGPDLPRIEARTLRSADAVVVVSEALRDYALARGVEPSRICVLPNGADPAPRSESTGEVWVLGYAGTFKPWQALPAAVPALASLADELAPRSLRLELHGDGPDRAALISGARAAGVEVDARGWSRAAELTAARRGWSGAWVPAARAVGPALPWLGDPPARDYFSPLKGAEAAAAGLPTWHPQGGLQGAAPPPPSWSELVSPWLPGPGAGRRRE